ncbi:TlpA family protein disulfide reductase [Hymenobacter sp. 15J16-1T3B]|uniref:TlpA family protein disulfide reductase n=1 Tax=Hymenobacter sp. 15J16-1T3B TaxID=2886941 RepID=UPI001D123950|nr:TlpA disulfide reductase family protein [Hymenobacter sp. 15J16-1T3B]MCC3158987.1 TlpA family protein disulfide reductase [Hymenobacter sp. 15J16-1T3B]
MRTYVLLAALGCLTAAGGSEPGPYELRGQLRGVPAGTKVRLTRYQNQRHVALDSAAVDASGQFVLQGRLAEAGMYAFEVQGLKSVTRVPLAPGAHVRYDGTVDKLRLSAKLSGSPDAELWQRCSADIPFLLFEQHKATNGRLQQLQRLLRAHPDSYAGAYFVRHFLTMQESQQPFVDSMAAEYQRRLPDLALVRELTERRGKRQATAVHDLAPDIRLPDPSGQPVVLSSLRGKYVLVDFWASWCGPCREENPALVKLYQQYHPKGLEILSVSLDESKDKWEKAIRTDGLPWLHASDLKGWQSEAGQAYNVTAVPYCVLVDPEGRIVAKDLRGGALARKVAGLLK